MRKLLPFGRLTVACGPTYVRVFDNIRSLGVYNYRLNDRVLLHHTVSLVALFRELAADSVEEAVLSLFDAGEQVVVRMNLQAIILSNLGQGRLPPVDSAMRAIINNISKVGR